MTDGEGEPAPEAGDVGGKVDDALDEVLTDGEVDEGASDFTGPD